MEDREIHEPDRHCNGPLEQFLHVGQDDIGTEQAYQRAIAQASGHCVDETYGNQLHREHVETGSEDPALVDGEMGELCPNQDREPGQQRSRQEHQDIGTPAREQDLEARLRGAEQHFQTPVFQVCGPLQGQGQGKGHDEGGHEREEKGAQQRGVGVGGRVEKEVLQQGGLLYEPVKHLLGAHSDRQAVDADEYDAKSPPEGRPPIPAQGRQAHVARGQSTLGLAQTAQRVVVAGFLLAQPRERHSADITPGEEDETRPRTEHRETCQKHSRQGLVREAGYERAVEIVVVERREVAHPTPIQ